ncbi:hypothetical protein O59_001729 [Cellvibrio sp. BR]|uniref:DUF5655 domain-containing protein n=1 Tax=Cellvibrio sp. BR TaxID=1134474 RepID=UPI0002600CE6|nr:DUF5655 domain-containing protein [Cellvibrio sp. BR]EIK45055.1 hypothetical protein O59_001729 [Cellvibrio sp. BR]
MNFKKLKTVNLKSNPVLTEKWLQDIIAQDPSVLGIGDVLLKDKERIHPGAGRLDLLLQDADGHGRYEVEIQLGATDESHLIRTIEYWDIERKKYPQYDHTAVIIAENITSRFFNVISLFNGFIPLMAIQVTAIETEGGVGLLFTKVLDTVKLGYLGDDEEISEPTDRSYWESVRGTKKTVGLADKILELVHQFAPNAELSYNKYYIGFWIDGRAYNFAIMRPQKSGLRLEIRLPKEDETDNIINSAELDMLDYDTRWRSYRIKLNEESIVNKNGFLLTLLNNAYESRR